MSRRTRRVSPRNMRSRRSRVRRPGTTGNVTEASNIANCIRFCQGPGTDSYGSGVGLSYSACMRSCTSNILEIGESSNGMGTRSSRTPHSGGRHIISQGTHRYSCPGTTITHECTRIKKDNQGRI